MTQDNKRSELVARLSPVIREYMQVCEEWSKTHYSNGLREAAYCALALQDKEVVARLYQTALDDYRYNKPWTPEYKYIHLFEDVPGRMALMLEELNTAESIIVKLLDEPYCSGYGNAYKIALHHPDQRIAHNLIRKFEAEGFRPTAISLASEIGDYETAKRLLEEVIHDGVRIEDGEFHGYRSFWFVLAFPELGKKLGDALEQTSYGHLEAGLIAGLLGDYKIVQRVKQQFSEPHIRSLIAAYAGDTLIWQHLFLSGVRSLSLIRPQDEWMYKHEPMGKKTNWIFLEDIKTVARRNPEAAEQVLKPLAEEGHIIALLASGILDAAYKFPVPYVPILQNNTNSTVIEQKKLETSYSLVGVALQQDKTVPLNNIATLSAINNYQPLTPALINSALSAMDLKYQQDDDGVYLLEMPDDTVTVGLSLPSSSELRIICVYTEPVPQLKWLNAFLACNEFHKSSKLGHAYLLPKSETDGVFVYEVWWDFENGMVSEDYLLRHTILRAIEQAGELFTKIAQECNR